jgi:hypothetical protein
MGLDRLKDVENTGLALRRNMLVKAALAKEVGCDPEEFVWPPARINPQQERRQPRDDGNSLAARRCRWPSRPASATNQVSARHPRARWRSLRSSGARAGCARQVSVSSWERSVQSSKQPKASMVSCCACAAVSC